MLLWAKYLAFFCAIGLAVFLGNHYFSQQKLNNLSIQEVEVALKTQAIGLLRNSGQTQMSKSDLINELVTEVVQVQKNHGKVVQISYVFLNKEGTPTELESEMDSVQFCVELIGKNHQVEARSERRLTLLE